MIIQTVLRPAALVLFAVLSMPASIGTPPQKIVRPLSMAKLSPDSDVKCLQSFIESGDPSKSASTLLLHAPFGCEVPWHYHTANEELIVVSGSLLTEMKTMPQAVLGPGGFASMPGEATHQFSCKSKKGCLLFVSFDAAYDVVWVK